LRLDKIIEKKYNLTYKNYPGDLLSRNKGILKEILDRHTYSKLINIRTKEGYTLDDIIQPGIDNPEYQCCLVAPSSDAYFKFSQLFTDFIKYFIPSAVEDLSKPFENESYSMIKSMTMGMNEILAKQIKELYITTNRNVEGYSFTPKMNRNERREVGKYLHSAMKEIEFDAFTHEKINNNQKLINDSDRLLKSAGVYRDGPENRWVYHVNSSGGDFTLFINEEDHLKLKLQMKCDYNEENTNISKNILTYFEFLEKIEKKVNFAMHDNLGFLNTLPTNIGTGTYFKVKIKISPDKLKHVQIIKKMEENSKDINFEIKSDAKTEYYLEMESKNPFYSFSTCLVDILAIKDYLK
jgi:creatine kinase